MGILTALFGTAILPISRFQVSAPDPSFGRVCLKLLLTPLVLLIPVFLPHARKKWKVILPRRQIQRESGENRTQNDFIAAVAITLRSIERLGKY